MCRRIVLSFQDIIHEHPGKGIVQLPSRMRITPSTASSFSFVRSFSSTNNSPCPMESSYASVELEPQHSFGLSASLSSRSWLSKYKSASQSRLDAPSILVSGYLTMRRHAVPNWTTRFFVLQENGRLSYYSDKLTRKMGEVCLIKVSLWDGEPFGFMFSTTKQVTYYVSAGSESERHRWLEALSDFRGETSDADHEGYLSKQRTLVPGFRRCYFVLHGTKITQFSDEDTYRTSAAPLATFEVKIAGRWKAESSGLYIQATSGKMLFLCAENDHDVQEWLKALPTTLEPMACAGWLTKQGHKRKNWKKRYFVLRGRTISYFPDFDSSNSRLMKPLGEVMVQQAAAWDGADFGFMFVTSENIPYYVFADNERDVAKWLAALGKTLQPTSSLPTVETKSCPRCGSVLTGSRYCGACGFDFVKFFTPPSSLSEL
ncbi:hypothetical protein Ae201684P_011013 [Aphanomyces euteiches]|uniref:PH domain-containing protein n=1 Tax=Aphanomyces euteiches TaxID=100861 RepID=A0A6G0XYG3_9STRA|nr:hypothetical protein Ae201684_000114 [Aphanomyces euteiches]KAH9091468.1 hypothetical protein Ae201684P_011013 [Aphanomyces euteiches]KAH9146206.1 hypothetical protein AeRB84_009878 [Aphanomyces euteiches]